MFETLGTHIALAPSGAAIVTGYFDANPSGANSSTFEQAGPDTKVVMTNGTAAGFVAKYGVCVR